MPASAGPSLRSFSFSVTITTVGVGAMHQFLLPELTRLRAAAPTKSPD